VPPGRTDTVAGVRMAGGSILPVLVAVDDDHGTPGLLRDEFLGGLAVAYSFGPPYGERLIGRADLGRLGLTRADLHRLAAGNLRAALDRVRIHGEPPSLMLSFDGLESSALLDAEFWEDLRGTVPGELVVGVPARDVVIVTGSWSRQGMERVRRAVDRIFFAGGPGLLSRDLLVWRRRAWEVLRPVARDRRTPRSTAPPP
jgi:uncharacterized protein YtpQ (UPF0354 family)